jgi:septal ring factor EnvC (AmiA/AmiB activator)
MARKNEEKDEEKELHILKDDLNKKENDLKDLENHLKSTSKKLEKVESDLSAREKALSEKELELNSFSEKLEKQQIEISGMLELIDETQAEKPEGSIVAIRVSSRTGQGFYRAGMHFTSKPIIIRKSELSLDQLRAIQNENRLKVDEILINE